MREERVSWIDGGRVVVDERRILAGGIWAAAGRCGGGAVRGFGGVGEATKFQAIRGVCCGADTVGSGNQNSATGIFERGGGDLPAYWNAFCFR